jgi:hypothetical protein
MRALFAATNRELLVGSGESKKAFGLAPEQLAKMERDVEGFYRELKLIEESYGTETLNLVLARGIPSAPPQHNRLMRYLTQHHKDLLVALQAVVDDSAPEMAAVQG